MQLAKWLKSAEQRLGAAGIDTPRLDAQLLAAHVLRVDRSWVLVHPEHEFNELAGETLLQRREKREPIAYILGYREFYGRTFQVGPGVLVPRQDTEILVEEALDVIGRKETKSVLDLGAGSGCISITLKLERPEIHLIAVDNSPDALHFTQENAKELGVEIDIRKSDVFSGLEGMSFDLIVTNPPYIAIEEEIMPEVHQYEPAEALFAGTDGLDFYRMLAGQARAFLNEKGCLCMEVGYQQAGVVQELFADLGWKVCHTRKDLSGIERVITVEA